MVFFPYIQSFSSTSFLCHWLLGTACSMLATDVCRTHAAGMEPKTPDHGVVFDSSPLELCVPGLDSKAQRYDRSSLNGGICVGKLSALNEQGAYASVR